MLNRPLVSAYVRKGVVTPAFVPVTHPELLMLAEQLLGLYRTAAAEHQAFSDVDDMAQAIVNGARNRRISLGLRKLLEERCTFSNQSGLDYPALRRPVFEAAAALLKGGAPLPSIEAYQRMLSEKVAGNPLVQEGQLYGDLPENDRLLAFDDMNARQLLERYNVALVQALLLDAGRLEATITCADAPRLRRIFKYMRFFDLLATVRTAEQGREPSSGAAPTLEMTVDGPASVLEHSRQYGMKLAAFFPALCTADAWKICAEVTWKEKPALLKLDQTSQLVCPYHNYAAYVPDEVKLFQSHFEEEVPEWRIVSDDPVVKGEGREIIVPDFTFRKGNGPAIHLELFNRWHANGLKERLAWLQRHARVHMILGVDLALAKKPAVAEVLEASEWFAKYGFTYRDYPTCGKVRRALEAWTG